MLIFGTHFWHSEPSVCRNNQCYADNDQRIRGKMSHADAGMTIPHT